MKKIQYNTVEIPSLVRRQDLFYNKIRKIAQEIKLDEVMRMQAAIIDLSSYISANASQAEDFLKAHIIGGMPIANTQDLNQYIKSFTESLSLIGSPGKQGSPDGIWGRRTDIALDKISKFSNSLDEFFTKNGWKPAAKITKSIQELNRLILSKYYQTSADQKKEISDQITPILSDIKNLFSSIPNMISKLNEQGKQVKVDISGDKAVSTPSAQLGKEKPEASNKAGDAESEKQELIKWWDSDNVEASRDSGSLDNSINRLFPGQIDSMKKMPIQDFKDKMKQGYIKYLNTITPENIKRIYKEYSEAHANNGAKDSASGKEKDIVKEKFKYKKSDEQVLKSLCTKLPLNQNQINIPKIEAFVNEYSLYSPSEHRPELLSSVNNAIKGLKDNFDNIYYHNLGRNYQLVNNYVNTYAKNKDDSKNVSKYLDYLEKIVIGVGDIVLHILESSEKFFTENDRDKEKFEEQTSHTATGNIYDVNIGKIEDWIADLNKDLSRGKKL
jgi:hypothetical protein